MNAKMKYIYVHLIEAPVHVKQNTAQIVAVYNKFVFLFRNQLYDLFWHLCFFFFVFVLTIEALIT